MHQTNCRGELCHNYSMFILPFHSNEAMIEIVGGKGINLIKLSQAGFNVPAGFIICTNAYKAFIVQNNLQHLIDDALRRMTSIQPALIDSISAEIRQAFSNGLVPEVVDQELSEFFGPFKTIPVAVRSSATFEDLPDLSFAGQQDTFLNIVGGTQLHEALKSCWSRFFRIQRISYGMV